MTLLPLLLTTLALATEECPIDCAALDAADELCEANFGDGDALCESIGDTDEDYCPDGGAFTGSCADACAEVDEIDDACDTALGEAHEVCRALDAIAEACEAAGTLPDDDDDSDSDDDDDDTAASDDEASGTPEDVAACDHAGTAPAFGLLAAMALFRRRR
jgi:hypothetical protein